MRISDWSSDVCSSDLMGAVLGPLHHTANDGIVPLWPVEASLHPPTINDVADQVERIAVDMVEKVDQEPVVAAACAEVDVRYPDRPIAPPGRPRRAYALHCRSEERRVGEECVSRCRYRGWP